MLSKIAKIDLEQLRKNGFNPTDEEIIKLNDIAIRIENGKNTTPANMPKMAFAGSVVFHEPTIGALEWWFNIGRDAFDSLSGQLFTHYFMLAHSRKLDVLTQLDNVKDIKKAVKEWKKKIDATEDELFRAMMYVKGENIDELHDEKKENLTDDEIMNKLWMTVISAAGALGVIPSDLKTITQSELVNTLIQANIHARIPMKSSVAKEYIAYKQLLKQIEDRGSTNV